MTVPGKAQCYRLLHEAGTLPHIAAHSIQVCRVALLIAEGLMTAGADLRRGLVQAGALLHDVTKTRSISTGERHAESGGQYLAELGFPETGEIVRQHVRLDDFRKDGPVTEAEIVNYADKRVIHDRITPLQDRMAYILDRYGRTPQLAQRLAAIWEETLLLEEKLFTPLPFDPGSVAGLLPDDGRRLEMTAYERTTQTY